jgi:hypothetical protein
VVKLLRGIDINARDKIKVLTSLPLAAFQGHEGIVKLLLVLSIDNFSVDIVRCMLRANERTRYNSSRAAAVPFIK